MTRIRTGVLQGYAKESYQLSQRNRIILIEISCFCVTIGFVQGPELDYLETCATWLPSDMQTLVILDRAESAGC